MVISATGVLIRQLYWPQFTFSPNANLGGDPDWQRVQQTHTLVVGLAPDHPPFAYVDSAGPAGYEVALAQELGRRLGLTVELSSLPFERLIPAVEARQVDVALSGLVLSSADQARVDFSAAYYTAEDAVLVNAAAPAAVGRVQDLARYRVGVQQGSNYQRWLLETLVYPGLMPAADLVAYPSIAEAVQGLAGAAPPVNVVVVERIPAQVAWKGLPLIEENHGLHPHDYRVALPRGAATLRTQIDNALEQMHTDGTLTRLAQQYLGQPRVGVASAVFLPVSGATASPTPPAAALTLTVLPPTASPAPPTATPLPGIVSVPVGVGTGTAPPPAAPGQSYSGGVPPALQPSGACVDSMQFVADLNYPDKNMRQPYPVSPGQAIDKLWRVRNTGSCIWDSRYVLGYAGSEPASDGRGGSLVALAATVLPGQEIDMAAGIIAPSQPGRYKIYYALHNPQGQRVGHRLWAGLEVVVAGPQTLATPNLPVIYAFRSAPQRIRLGQCVKLQWGFDGHNLANSQLFRGAILLGQGLHGNGEFEDCPQTVGNVEYRLVVAGEYGNTTMTSLIVNVDPPPPPPPTPAIQVFKADRTEIRLGEYVTLTWAYTGDAPAIILRDRTPITGAMPNSGSLVDRPTAPGLVVYLLQAGSASHEWYVNVLP